MKKPKKYTREQVAALTQKWYKKLAEDGFEDLEWYHPSVGFRLTKAIHSKKQLGNLAAKYNEQTEFFYSMCRNFATHYTFSTKRDQLCFELFAEGIRFREIIKIANKKFYKYPVKCHLRGLHEMLKAHVAICIEWNKTNPEGLRYNSPDVMAEEVLIQEPEWNKDPA